MGAVIERPSAKACDLDTPERYKPWLTRSWRVARVPRVGVPILIFVVGFVGGAMVPARWLPDLGEGRVAGIAFLVVCGLVGMVFALVALHVYEIVRQLDTAGSLGAGNAKPDVIANGLLAMLRDIGPILGLAGAVYLLAPAPDDDESLAGPPEAAPGYSSEPAS